MSTVDHTIEPTRTLPRVRISPRHLALTGILALSGLLEFNNLTQNGYANTYYSGAVKSMLGSLHNFFFVASDPGGLVSVDKPPLALWLQTISAKIFGFSSFSLLLPEALCALLAVFFLYRIVAPRFGVPAALLSALALAVFPAFVAVTRDNQPDALLILLMVLSCGAALKAIETGRLRTLLWCAVLVGLAFNTKMLAAFLVVPGIAIAYLLCAPGPLRRRITHLAAAGAVLAIVSVSWLAAVQLTPSDARPWVGSTDNNNAFSLAVDYNGLGRVEGQQGGPGQIGGGRQAGGGPGGGGAQSTTFGGPTGPLRLLGSSLGDQAGWLIPLALFGGLAVALTLSRRRRDPKLAALLVIGGWFVTEALILSFSKGIIHPYYTSALGPGVAALVGAGALALLQLAKRADWRLAVPVGAIAATAIAQVILLDRVGFMGWFVPILVVGAIVLTALVATRHRFAGPALAAVVGLLLIAPAAYATTTWDAPVNGTFPAAGNASGFGAGGTGPAGGVGIPPGLGSASGSGSGGSAFPGMSGTIPGRTGGGLPGMGSGFSGATGAFPGGPSSSSRGSTGGLPGGGMFGGGSDSQLTALGKYVQSHDPGSRWDVLTQTSREADPMILDGIKAGSMGGFNGDDPVLNTDAIAKLVSTGEVRYFALGDAFPGRTGSSGVQAVEKICTAVPSSTWGGTSSQSSGSNGAAPGGMGTTLYDCLGKASQLAAAG
ncbi:MAG TPA: glycosyltransferase family 39 protein [Solirubrobacterales bacterium]|nr:glycosyltransferase family 39 protein [Solirubrobacterales bacterium]